MANPNSSPPLEESNIQEELPVVSVDSPGDKKSSSPWKLITGIMMIILVAGGGGIFWFTNNQENNTPATATPQQPQALPVKLETLNLQPLTNTTTVIGTLDAPKAITVKSEVEGRISQILVNEGANVQQGEVIFIIESDELQSELSQAQAQLQSAEARLAQLKAGSRSEDIGEAQAQLNQAIARLENAKIGALPEEIAQVKAQIESAEAELDLARDRVKRYKKLEEEGAISEDEFAVFLKTERQAMASLTEAQKRLSALSKGRTADVSDLQAQVEQARQNLRRLENGARVEEIAQAEADVAQRKGNISSIEVQIRKTEVLAPFTGVIGDIPVKLGDYVESGEELTTLTENNVLEVNLSVPVEQAQDLRLGLPVMILNAQGETITSAKISFISPNVTTNSQLVLAKATLDRAVENLLNRGSVQAQIIWSENQGILVPATAVSRLGNKTFVFVAESAENAQPDKPSLIAKQKLIQLGSLQGNDYQVLEGLEAGQQIVTAGIMNLRDDTPIMPLPQ
jgi:RND family efflux transporter MFP subunit